MRKTGLAAIVTLAFTTLLAGCDSDDPVFPTIQQPPPPPPMVWDQGNWDDVLWQ